MKYDPKTMCGALSAIVYLDLSHLPPEEQIAKFKEWARMGLEGTPGNWTIVDLTGTMPGATS